MTSIDLNCDLGESFGHYRLGEDEAMMPLITSANIACGFHAGDPHIMRKTVQMCLEHQVSIGAHPGFPDLAGFGRRKMQITSDEVYNIVLYQIGSLHAFIQAEGGKLNHVKPHGALYNMAAVNRDLADAVAQAVHDFDATLTLFGLAGSELIRAGEEKGLRCANEAFADRTYQQDGTLTPRNHCHAIISDPKKAAEQVSEMLQQGTVTTVTGNKIPMKADTVCIHGDSPQAVLFANHIVTHLKGSGCLISSF